MQNPLEHFLSDLANKIQTAKEYKDIIQDSQNVDVNKNVFEGFMLGVAETIKKELKDRQPETTQIEAVSSIADQQKDVEPEQQDDPLSKFVTTLASTISASKNKPIEQKKQDEDEEKKVEDKPVPEPVLEPQQDSFEKFIGNLKDIIQKNPKETPSISSPIVDKKDKPKTGVKDYVKELDKKAKDENEEKPKSKSDLIKDLVRKFVEGEIKGFKDEISQKFNQVGAAYGGGGGTNAVQYAKGGTMDGDLNVTGHYLSAGVDLLNIFTGGGGGGGDPAVNALVYSNSANWNTAYTNLVNNSASYLTGTAVNLGDIPVLSANWNNTYTQYSTYSAVYARTDQNVTFQNNVTILGNLTAKGTATFANTIFTTTSALSVVNNGPGPALYVFQAAGPSDVASFYDGDGVEVLHVGNANPGGLGYVGINESFPGAELTVQGNISASRSITVAGGNSNQWNTAYTNLVNNSASYLTGTAVNLGNIPTLSSNWNSNYSTTSYFSAFWNAAVDELFTFYVTQTSAASAFWTEDGNYYFIQNSKLDNVPLWNNMYTTLYLNSAGWESTETTVRTASANWNSTYSSLSPNSAKYDSVYTTYNQNSASYATEILAIAYAVAL